VNRGKIPNLGSDATHGGQRGLAVRGAAGDRQAFSGGVQRPGSARRKTPVTGCQTALTYWLRLCLHSSMVAGASAAATQSLRQSSQIAVLCDVQRAQRMIVASSYSVNSVAGAQVDAGQA
jgi:hypothetical protein